MIIKQHNLKLLLLGYRATGKSSAGRMLAERHGVDFIDTDTIVEELAAKSVKEIVKESGWAGFRAMEKQALGQAVGNPGCAVVACGGGAVLHGDVLGELPACIHTVWLQASVDIIAARIEGDSRSDSLRPSLTDAESLREEVENVLAEREPLYRKFSEFIINTDKQGLEETVNELAVIWEKFSRQITAGET